MNDENHLKRLKNLFIRRAVETIQFWGSWAHLFIHSITSTEMIKFRKFSFDEGSLSVFLFKLSYDHLLVKEKLSREEILTSACFFFVQWKYFTEKENIGSIENFADVNSFLSETNASFGKRNLLDMHSLFRWWHAGNNVDVSECYLLRHTRDLSMKIPFLFDLFYFDNHGSSNKANQFLFILETNEIQFVSFFVSEKKQRRSIRLHLPS